MPVLPSVELQNRPRPNQEGEREMKARLYDKYTKEVREALKDKLSKKNVHEVPRMEKIVINMGVSAALEKGAVDDAARDLAQITGQKPVIAKARKSIANFK